MIRTITAYAFLSLAFLCASVAFGDTFGGGENTFNIEFVPIGNPDNPADATGAPNPAGSVPYTYRMGKYEISEDMINKANAEGDLGITHGNRGANKPVANITWFEAATFVNWLNTSTGHTLAYEFSGGTFEPWQPGDAGYNPNNPFRNTQAFYFLPSADEWYKAAYYDPSAGIYYDYPTGSDTAPTAVASGTAADTAVYGQSTIQGPADITLAGGLSPYGTMGQGGNAVEWNEWETDLAITVRGVRGGAWDDLSSLNLLSSVRVFDIPSDDNFFIGFRVASVPEPSAMSLACLGVFALLCLFRRL